MRDKITVIGSLNYDEILKIARLPEMGETFYADDVAFSAGGKGANQAVWARIRMEKFSFQRQRNMV